MVSLERIEAFLHEEEVSEEVSSLKATPVGSGGSDDGKNLSIERGYFQWESNLNNKPEERQEQNGKLNAQMPSSAEGIEATTGDNSGESVIQLQGTNHFQLRNITVCFPKGKLSVITGPTGSGKTALLVSCLHLFSRCYKPMHPQLALLGEMTKLRGTLNLSKGIAPTISYAAQTPWLQRRTIKENILFGYRYDEQRYNDVVECCALRPDLDALEDGDETLIGDRWVLSGVRMVVGSY